MYAFYDKDITQNKTFKILNDKDEIIREEYITKDINYIFYSSMYLNENYSFYLKNEDNESKLNMTFGKPKEGKDDEDKGDSENLGKYLQSTYIIISLSLILF